MNARNAFNPDLDERAEFPKLKAAHGEDPARFLQSSKDLAFARIRGIRDPELLTAYAAVAKQILSGSEKRDVLEAIDAREAELDDDPTTETVAATDGGTVKSPDDNAIPTADPTTTADSEEVTSSSSESASDPDEIHPDTEGLEVGEVARINRDDATEYVWPATPAADGPYLLRVFDAEGDERTDGALALSQDEYRARMDFERDTMAVGLIDIDAPREAATNGGGSE